MAQLKNLMISVSGVRGIVGDGLTPDVALKFAQAYGSEFGPGKVVLGRDSRVTGEMMKNAICAGLMAVGCDVVDIGIATTPTTELVTEKDDMIGGIIITASHNPKEWNALKLLGKDGLFLSAEEGERVLNRVNNDDYNFANWDKVGKISSYDKGTQEHVDKIFDLEIISPELIKSKKFKIVADPCNGAGGTILPSFLEQLGCEVEYLNLEPNGLFPRSPEPIPQNLTELADAVKKHGADLGIAVDPDVDRVAFVDETGRPCGEEFSLVLATQFVLSKTPGDVVINASTSRAIDDVTEAAGGKVHRAKVGEINVSLKAIEIKAAMCGEGNGGVMYPGLHYGRDAIVGIAIALQALAESGKTISQLFAESPQYTMIKDKVQLAFGADAKGAVQKLQDAHANDNLDLIDGCKILYDDSWVHIRASNTEPIIRVIAEAPTPEAAQKLVDQYKTEIQNIG